MKKKLTPQLEEYKKDFEYHHKKIGELEWKLATIFYGKKAVARTEIDKLEIRLENHRVFMSNLIEDIQDEINKVNRPLWDNNTK